MKLISSIILLTVLASSCTSDPKTPNDTRPSPNYHLWKTGKFYYNEPPFGVFLVNRTDSIQEEFIKNNGILVEFNISWQNDSSYTMTFHREVENPSSVELPSDLKDLVRTCTLTHITDSSYIERALTNLNDDTLYTTFYNK